MKFIQVKKLLFLIAVFCVLKANAQTYLISFAGTGLSTTVNTVKVENLTASTSLTLNEGDILQLTGTTGVYSVEKRQSSEMKIYPNPMTGNSILQIYPPEAGSVVITVFDMTGKAVAQIQSYLENSLQEFRLSGINSGFYMISVKGNTYQYSGKLLCSTKSNGTISVEKISNNQAVAEKISKTNKKGTQSTVDMAYTNGDRLKFTGISGNYSTVKIDIPASDKTITFNFIACKDGDNNNYPVVMIGTQVWMAESLKTTKYNDGADIPLVTVAAEWSNRSTPGYCWYNNDEVTYKNTFGALYNWYTVNNGNICPTNWHVPSHAEWTILTDYLGGTSVAGGKLKETGTTHWNSPNSDATNESGFTALPGGTCRSTGEFGYIGNYGDWWSATEYDATRSWNRYLYYGFSEINSGLYTKDAGFCIRCLKD